MTPQQNRTLADVEYLEHKAATDKAVAELQTSIAEAKRTKVSE